MSWKYIVRGGVALTIFNVSLQAVEKSVVAGVTFYGAVMAVCAFALIVQALFICVEGVK